MVTARCAQTVKLKSIWPERLWPCSPSPRLGRQPSLAAGLGELAHAQNVALPFRDRDHATRIKQIEDVARLDALVVGRQRHQVPPPVANAGPAGAEIFLARCLRH